MLYYDTPHLLCRFLWLHGAALNVNFGYGYAHSKKARDPRRIEMLIVMKIVHVHVQNKN